MDAQLENDDRGFAFKPLKKRFGVVSLRDSDDGTMAHELGHILGLVHDNVSGHNDISKTHLLMRRGAEHLGRFSRDSKRFRMAEQDFLLRPNVRYVEPMNGE